MKTNILVPTDFSQAAANALLLATEVVKGSEAEIVLFHVVTSHTASLLRAVGRDAGELEDFLKSLAAEVQNSHGVSCRPEFREGSIFNEIPRMAVECECGLVIMGTHGTRGIRQNLFGADILKIVRKSPVLVLLVSEITKVDGILDRILFPYGGEGSYQRKAKAVGDLSVWMKSSVVFYTIDKIDTQNWKEVENHISQARNFLEESGIKTESVRDEPGRFSIGYAKQTLEYAKDHQLRTIALMAEDGDAPSVISEVDREMFVNNAQGIAVLFVPLA